MLAKGTRRRWRRARRFSFLRLLSLVRTKAPSQRFKFRRKNIQVAILSSTTVQRRARVDPGKKTCGFPRPPSTGEPSALRCSAKSPNKRQKYETSRPKWSREGKRFNLHAHKIPRQNTNTQIQRQNKTPIGPTIKRPTLLFSTTPRPAVTGRSTLSTSVCASLWIYAM